MLQTSIKPWQHVPEDAGRSASPFKRQSVWSDAAWRQRSSPSGFPRILGVRSAAGRVASPCVFVLQSNLIVTHAHWGYVTVSFKSNSAQQFLIHIVSGDVQNWAGRHVLRGAMWKPYVIPEPTSRAATCVCARWIEGSVFNTFKMHL